MPDSNDNPNYRRDILGYLDVHNLVDVWRTLNPYKRVFTWHRGAKRSRLDYLFISEHLLNTVSKSTIEPGIHSDHSLLTVALRTGNTESRGRGFWKFNASLLNDTQYVESIKRIISLSIARYQGIQDKGLVWDMVKAEIRGFTIPYCARKKREADANEANLRENFTTLYDIVNSNCDIDNQVLEQYYSIKSELQLIERHKARGIIMRSKAQWVEEGERNTAYFLRLEKNNYCNKHITKLQTDTEIITDPGKILEEQKRYYKNLYTEPNECIEQRARTESEFIQDLSFPKLEEDQKDSCDRILTEKELLSAVKEIKNGKSPGTDGLTSEFYKFFWIDIKEILLSSLNFALETGTLSIEQKRGILTLIPKKDKDRLLLKNWRPLTLLNLDYKILAKALAKRMIQYLPFLIDEDQTGYVKGRFIGCNIRLIEDLLIYTSANKVDGILLTIDFEKAFDSISWSFMLKSLHLFNFGQKFISYIKTLYNGISTTVINNGHISGWFHPERGVRQGCPISPYLFIIAVEVLSCKIRQCKHISGISIRNKEIKISQLADDTTCVIKDERSLISLLHVLQNFKTFSGLGINVDKTIAKSLGNFVPSSTDLCGLDWNKNDIETLGVTLNGNEEDHYILNFKKRIKRFQALLNSWKCRHLSLKGKITIINTLALPSLLYLASVIHVNEKVIKEVHKIILDFIWDGKVPKVAHATLVQNISEGGLKLVDFESKVRALRVGWINRLTDSSCARWKAAPSVFYRTQDLRFFFQCNHARKNDLKPLFYNEVHNALSDINIVSAPNVTCIMNQVIWLNRYITIQNIPFLWSEWLHHGILRISDITDEHGNFLSVLDIRDKYGIQCNFLNILQLRQSLPGEWRRVLSENHNCLVKGNEEILLNCNAICKPVSKCETKLYYSIFVKNKQHPPPCIEKWKTVFAGISHNEWPDIFTRAFKNVRETKIQSFQFRLIHRVITCNKRLYDMRMRDTPTCSYCDQVDSISHFFIHCPQVKVFWISFYNWLNATNTLEIQLPLPHDHEILFGYSSDENVFCAMNFCLLYAKYYIHTQRLFHNNEVCFRDYLRELKFKLQIEENICSRSDPTLFDKFRTLYEFIH